MSAVRVERRGKSSPVAQETERPCKLYPMQHRGGTLRGCPSRPVEMAGAVQQCTVEIDDRSRQNSAYSSAHLFTKEALFFAAISPDVS